MGNQNSGRKPKSYHRQITELILAETSPKAAQYLRAVALKELKGQPLRVDVCKYIINQDLGAPAQRAKLNITQDGELTVHIDGPKP